MVTRNSCIYENQYIGIEEFYTVHDGKQINIQGRIEEFRKLGKEKKLFCPCGCGRNLGIVAGEKMLRRQRFRVFPDQKEIKSQCNAVEENEITISSKILLKCWLDDILKLEPGEVRLNIPISDIYDEKRRFEYTHFVSKYNFGICYERDDTNLKDEKIDLLVNHAGKRFLYVTDISNEGTNGQYPEFMIKIQNFQGFCMLLDIHNELVYDAADAKILYYQKNDQQLWQELCVVNGRLREFSIDENGMLLYKGEHVSHMVSEKILLYEKEQKEELEERRRRYEEELKRIENERNAALEEEKRRREEQEQKVRERKEAVRQNQEKYFSEHPKVKRLVRYIGMLDRLEGTFSSRQGNGYIKNRNEKIEIAEVMYDCKNHRVEIQDKDYAKFYVYVSEDVSSNPGFCRTGAAYSQLDLSHYDEDDVIPQFRKKFICIEKNEIKM